MKGQVARCIKKHKTVANRWCSDNLYEDNREQTYHTDGLGNGPEIATWRATTPCVPLAHHQGKDNTQRLELDVVLPLRLRRNHVGTLLDQLQHGKTLTTMGIEIWSTILFDPEVTQIIEFGTCRKSAENG